jgi:prepilin-type N-terminal cleavage/methylation domain-containing protein
MFAGSNNGIKSFTLVDPVSSTGYASRFAARLTGSTRVKTAFTLVELLIVIAILAVLAAAVVIVLNPAELLAQARDGGRISDMKAVQSALDIFTTDKPGVSQGSANIVYVSLPDSSPVCASHSLPALPAGWTYQCATSATHRNIDGTGWIPVDFGSLSGGSPIPFLPVDPQNDATVGKYYSYMVGDASGGNFLLTVPLESTKHLQGVAVKDGGTDSSRFEVGTNMALGASSGQLIAYWSFDESSGSVVSDMSGNGNSGTWSGAGSHSTAGKVGLAGSFDGDDYASFPGGLINGLANISVSMWVKTDLVDDIDGAICFETSGTSWRLCTLGDYVRLRDNDGLTHDVDLFPSITLESGRWYHFAFVHNGATQKFTPYVDGSPLGDTSCGTAMYSDMGSVHIGMPIEVEYAFQGAVDDVRVYSRALSVSEVDSIYRAAE